jgi:hypothetical protein
MVSRSMLGLLRGCLHNRERSIWFLFLLLFCHNAHTYDRCGALADTAPHFPHFLSHSSMYSLDLLSTDHSASHRESFSKWLLTNVIEQRLLDLF